MASVEHMHKMGMANNPTSSTVGMKPSSKPASSVGVASPASSTVGMKPSSKPALSVGVTSPALSTVGMKPSSKPASSVGVASRAISSIGKQSTDGTSIPDDVGSAKASKAASAVGKVTTSSNDRVMSGIASKPPSKAKSAVGSQRQSDDPPSGARTPNIAATVVGLQLVDNAGSGVGLLPPTGKVKTAESQAASAAAESKSGLRSPGRSASAVQSRPSGFGSASSQVVGSQANEPPQELKSSAKDAVAGFNDRVDGLTSSFGRRDSTITDEDIFAPTDERMQTIDFSRLRTQGIQVTKNEQKRKANVLQSLKKQAKNFFHENRAGQITDEQGNVELPMDPYVQAREDHDTGLLPSKKLFRLARHEQLQLRDRSRHHQKIREHEHNPAPCENLDDYEFAWMVIDHASRGARASAAGRSVSCFDIPDGTVPGGIGGGEDKETGVGIESAGITFKSKVGTNSTEFNERVKAFVKQGKLDSEELRGEAQREAEHGKAQRAQMLSLSGLVAAPTPGALSSEEQAMLNDFLKERSLDTTDGGDEKFPCDCCGPQAAAGAGGNYQAATYYDLLFAHRKNASFTVRFDMVHCLPRFVLHYKFHKQLYDCLEASERWDLVKAATDITMSYSLGNCTLQLPFGKYRTNAYSSLFAYIIVPDHVRYIEIFDVCNPQPAKPGVKQKKNSCIVPNWPDKSYVTEFWTYSKESVNSRDKDPRLETKLYEKNVKRKVELVPMPELLVTRRNPPSELASGKLKPQRGDYELFEDFVLIPHQDQPMLGFGSASHPKHEAKERSPELDIEFLDRLLQAMCAYVRRFVNTRQRRLAGREELSCTVNLSLHHSFAFKGHQRIYGFIGFPRTSTYWSVLAEEQKRIEALAAAAVTQADIRQMRAASRAASQASRSAGAAPSRTTGASAPSPASAAGRDSGTETEVDPAEIGKEAVEAMQEKLKSCSLM